jgi:hypothetical protein
MNGEGRGKDAALLNLPLGLKPIGLGVILRKENPLGQLMGDTKIIIKIKYIFNI